MKNNRLLYIDNLKLLMIIFVVIIHLSVTYSGIGGWYYIEGTEIGAFQTIFFAYFQSFTQGYFMGILFLVAGYFVPFSYEKKGFLKFIKERFIRLFIPTLIYMFIINPFISIVFLKNTNFYKNYITSFEFVENSGPLWFTFALFIFSMVYAFTKNFMPVKSNKYQNKFPSTVKIISLIFLISICAFLIRIIQPIGTSIINMQLCFFSQYIILFIIGINCNKNKWLEKLDYKKGRVWLISGLILGFILWLIALILGGALENGFEKFMGGFHWQSAIYALWESFISISMSIGLISLFKEKWNKQNKLVKLMSENAFSVYFFHAPIIVFLSIIFSRITIMPILKFFILSVISIPICFLFTNFIGRKIPFLRKLLV